MQVAELMTPDPLCVQPSTHLDEVLERMDAEHIRHLPVVEGGRLVGILSDRLLLGATGGLPSRLYAARGGACAEPPLSRAGQLARSSVLCAHPEESIASVCRAMRRESVGCVPVLREGALVGILTESDLLRGFERLRVRGRLAEWDDPAVESCMSTPVVSIEIGASLREAADRMLQSCVRHLLVLEGERLVGLLSERDVRRAYGAGRPDEYRVEDSLQTELWSAEPAERLSTAAKRMARHAISCLPVLEDWVVRGMLTSSDVLEQLAACADERGLGGERAVEASA